MARGRQTLTQRIALDGGEEIRKELETLGAAGEKAFAQLKAAAEKSIPTTALSKAIKKARADFATLAIAGSRFGQSVANLGTAFRAFETSLISTGRRIALFAGAVAGAAAAVIAFGKSGIDAVDEQGRQADALGLSITEYGRLVSAAGTAEVSQDEFAQAMERLNVAFGKFDKSANNTQASLLRLTDASIKVVRGPKELAKVTDQSADALVRLGIGIKDLNADGSVGEKTFLALADSLSKVADPTIRLNLAIELFGRKLALKMLPLLGKGRAGLKALHDEAERSGDVFSEADRAVAALADDALDKLSQAARGAKNQLALLFAPAITEGANALTEFIRENRAALEAFTRDLIARVLPTIRDFFNAVTGNDAAVKNKWIIEFRDGVIAFGKAVKSVIFDVVLPAFRTMAAFLDGVAATINKVFGTELTGAQILAGAAILKIIGGFKLLGAGIGLALRSIGLLKEALVFLGAALGPIVFGVGAVVLAILGFSKLMSELTGVPFPLALWITGGFASTTTVILVFWDEFVAMASAAFEQVKAGALAALAFIADTFTNGANFIGIVAEAWINGFARVWSTITAGASSAWDGIKSAAKSALDFVQSIVSSVISAINRALSALRSLRSKQSSDESSGFAGGGRVRGPGTGTSDSIPAWLSDGEFIIRAAAVRKYGAAFFAALNGMRMPKGGLAFGMGGLVDALAPRFASGGLVPAPAGATGRSGRDFTLVIDGQSFAGLTAPEDTARRLIKMAVGKQVRSNGRKPGWWGSNRS